MRLWIVAYDIADDRRRNRLARLLATRMDRVQESVFEGWLVAVDMRRLLVEVAAVIELGTDAVRAYPLAMRDDSRRQKLGDQPESAPLADHWIV